MPKKAVKKKYIPNSKEKYMCAKHKKYFTSELLKWKKDIIKFIPDKSLDWKVAKVIEINKLKITIETEDKEIGYISFNSASWTRKKVLKIF